MPLLSVLSQWYQRQLQYFSGRWLVVVGLALAVLGIQVPNFTLDASAESLLLEDDQDLALYRDVSERYGAQEFLVLTFTPEVPLFSDESLAVISQLRDELRDVNRVESVVSVLDVPLLSNPPVPLSELVSNIKTLEHPEANRDLAESELANSPLYVNLLLNLDANTTALQINFPIDETKQALLEMRDRIDEDSTESEQALKKDLVSELITEHNALVAERLAADIHQIRDIMTRYEPYGELHLGGVPMIANDIMAYVRKDLWLFGTSVFALVVITLGLIFRRPRWVLLPLSCASAVVVAMLGLLGWFQWPVTVISSNFVALLLILTLSMNIHLIVRYRELIQRYPEWSQMRLVARTANDIAVPCIYMTLTTAVAFVSLMASGIRPVINFGVMMTLGILVAFIMTFAFLPAALMQLGKSDEQPGDEKERAGPITRQLARLTLRNGQFVLLVSLLILAFTVLGVSRLIVENSFIDYFDENTEIYQGMSLIDERLGGTTPLEVLLTFDDGTIQPESEPESPAIAVASDPFVESDSFSDDPFVDDGGGDFVEEDFLSMDDADVGAFEDDFVGEDDPDKYWFTRDKISKIKQLHQYLDSLPETGKVLSLATMMEIAEDFNEGEPLTNLQLALLYSVIPQEFRTLVVDPYVSVDSNQARLNIRILDSQQGLQRDALLKRIERDVVDELGFEPGQVQLTGMMVLYNNMLQSLFDSQIKTLTGVFIGILVMFLVLFRSLKLALVAMVPNLLAATLVLGVMGWLGIPLDIMTITIASITIGIAVDNTIHYLVRYRREFDQVSNYALAVKRSHQSIGNAIFYTSITIILGFSILTLSNFKPTLYFGLLTALAMTVALLGALTLLPRLILMTRPFGPARAK